MEERKSRIILSLDGFEGEPADVVRAFGPLVHSFKIGLPLLLDERRDAMIAAIHQDNPDCRRIFIAANLADIANTVCRTIAGIKKFPGVSMVSVSYFGGSKVLQAAVQAAGDIRVIGFAVRDADTITAYAATSKTYGLAGFAVPYYAIRQVRKVCGSEFIVIACGLKPHRGGRYSPIEAIKDGATYAVIGWQTLPQNVGAAKKKLQEINTNIARVIA